MGSPFRTQRLVQFQETDAAGIAHFSSYCVYMEQAEHEMLRQLGTSVVARDDQGTISWPRVAASCNWTGSARFEDQLTIDVAVERLGRSSVTYLFTFRVGTETIAQGKMTSVCCRILPDQRPQPISIPATLRTQLEAYLSADHIH